MDENELRTVIDNVKCEINRELKYGVYRSDADFILYIGRRQAVAIAYLLGDFDRFDKYECLLIGGKESWVHLAAVTS